MAKGELTLLILLKLLMIKYETILFSIIAAVLILFFRKCTRIIRFFDTNAIYPNLSKTFYTNSSFLRHTYDYDLTDKKKRLKMISKDLRGASLLAIMASTATMIWVGEANDWSLAVSIPSAFALATATFIPLFLISSHIAKKAERLEVQTVMLSSLNSHTQIGLARFFDDNYLGFSIKTTF